MWSTILSGSVAYPGPARVCLIGPIAGLITPSCSENELIEFFEGVCIQSVHFTRDRYFITLCTAPTLVPTGTYFRYPFFCQILTNFHEGAVIMAILMLFLVLLIILS